MCSSSTHAGQGRVQHFRVFVHGSFTKPCVRSVDKPRELLRTPAFLAVPVSTKREKGKTEEKIHGLADNS